MSRKSQSEQEDVDLIFVSGQYSIRCRYPAMFIAPITARKSSTSFKSTTRTVLAENKKHNVPVKPIGVKGSNTVEMEAAQRVSAARLHFVSGTINIGLASSHAFSMGSAFRPKEMAKPRDPKRIYHKPDRMWLLCQDRSSFCDDDSSVCYFRSPLERSTTNTLPPCRVFGPNTPSSLIHGGTVGWRILWMSHIYPGNCQQAFFPVHDQCAGFAVPLYQFSALSNTSTTNFLTHSSFETRLVG